RAIARRARPFQSPPECRRLFGVGETAARRSFRWYQWEDQDPLRSISVPEYCVGFTIRRAAAEWPLFVPIAVIHSAVLAWRPSRSSHRHKHADWVWSLERHLGLRR